MIWFTWLRDNWFLLLQGCGVVAGLTFTGVALRHETKALQMQNLLAITTQHREIWSLVYSHSGLWRVLEPVVNLASKPVTAEERLFVNLLILHLTNSFAANKVGLFKNPEYIKSDVQEFFTLPIPAEVWAKAKTLQDSDFVKFVDSVLAYK